MAKLFLRGNEETMKNGGVVVVVRSREGIIDGSVEPLLEELLAEVVTGTRAESKGHNEDSFTAALTEAAMASFSRAVSQASAVERALLVEALAPALAEALAPALAKALAPEIITAFGHLAATPEAADEAEDQQAEHRQSEDQESEYQESGYQESGSQAPGSQESEYRESEYRESEYQESEYQESGYPESGYPESGYQKPTGAEPDTGGTGSGKGRKKGRE